MPLGSGGTVIVEGAGLANNLAVYRVAYPTAGVEMFQVLPAQTRTIYVGSENMNAKIRVAYIEDGTTLTENKWTTVQLGNSYYRVGLNLSGYVLYYQANKPGIVIELEIGWET